MGWLVLFLWVLLYKLYLVTGIILKHCQHVNISTVLDVNNFVITHFQGLIRMSETNLRVDKYSHYAYRIT